MEEMNRVSRRVLLRRASQSAVALTALSPLLAACGDDGDSGGSGGTSTGGGGAATSANGRKLQELLSLPSGKAAGAGLAIPMGASIILSGPYTSFGREHLNGLRLGVRHIKEAGGPNIELNVRDNAYTLAKGVANVREFAATECVAQFCDAAATLGAELPGYRQFKIFAMDPGGSIAGFAGSPFYYIIRPLSPEQYVKAWASYMREAFPDARTYALLGVDAGTDYNTNETRVTKEAAEANGFEFVGESHVPVDTSNFSAAFTKLRSSRPDVIQTALYGDQLGVMLKQYATSGLDAQLIGPDFTPGAQRIAGSSLKNYHFGNDWFAADRPTNEWGELFAKDYEAEFGALPTYHAAEYYQTAFFMWQVVRGVIEAGGDPTEPRTDNYVTALEARPEFPSVYGGSGATPGEFAFDVRQHIAKTLPCTVCSVSGTDAPVPRATFNVGDATVTMV